MMIVMMLMALSAAPVEPTTAPGTPGHCGSATNRTKGMVLQGATKLGDQPPAAQVRTVLRKDERGCSSPVVLRRGIGSNPDRALPID